MIIGMVWGREVELAAIDRLLASCRAGAGGALLVAGEPGIGKSTLLAYADGRPHGLRTLHAEGTEAESALAFSLLHQLLHPVLDRVGTLPAPQSRALRTALGLEAGPAPDRFLVSVAVLTLLSDLGEARPVLCLVDDVHWADGPSMEVLTFVARRLRTEPVALLVAGRVGKGCAIPAGISVLRLAGLEAEAAARLLDTRREMSLAPDVRDRLIAATRGNPLALIEISGTLTRRQLGGHDPLPDPLPLSGELERVYLEQVRRREPVLRSLLLLCAAEGTGHLDPIRRAAEVLGVDLEPLESGALADLVRIDGRVIAFRHPLVRSAAYHGACQADRRAAHMALADALKGDPAESDRRAWHRARAALGADEEVARDLEHSAERTLRRSGHAAAVTALEWAAALSPEEGDQARRIVSAADAAWLGGDTAHARDLLDRAERCDSIAPAVHGRIHYLRGMIELRCGVVADALPLLLPAAAKAVEVDPHLSLRMLIVASEAAFHANDAAATREIDRLMARLPHAGDSHDGMLARLFQYVAQINEGKNPPSLREDIAHAEQTEDPHILVRAGGVAFAQGDLALARRLRIKGVRLARTLGAAGTLAWALWHQANDEILRGRYAHAEALTDEGHRLALETHQPNLGWQHQATRVALAAVRGRKQEAQRLADEVSEQAGIRRLATAAASAHSALARLALAEGHGEETVQHLDAMRALMSTSHHRVSFTVIPDYVEAAVRVGQPARGRELFKRYLSDTDAAPPEARALAARAHALLTTGNEADRWFRQALALHTEADVPLDQARTALLYGEFLRRRRRRVDARTQLRNALTTFDRLGAAAWARRARGELRATGETVRKRHENNLDQLTPQELQVVQAVSQGATNREVAAQLFISPRTVDDHMRKVFRKLGISSRTELIRLHLDSPSD
ncbi:transcriptional regulator [Actinomadura sp. NBRC 104412]|nr:transcriptional regulator [Actinomadura sp. NBRC 104412]